MPPKKGTNSEPKILGFEDVPLEDISVSDSSSWREIDLERVRDLVIQFLQGQYLKNDFGPAHASLRK